jgi:hypothetical protein
MDVIIADYPESGFIGNDQPYLILPVFSFVMRVVAKTGLHAVS